MKRVLVYIDEDAVADSLDLLEVGRLMYGAQGFRSYALAAGGRYGEAGRLFDYVFRVKNGPLPNYDSAAIARCIETLHQVHHFDAIIFPATHCGRMIAPRAALRLHAGLVADVTGIETDGDEVWMVRPAFNGRMLAVVGCRGGGPTMMSVRRRVFTYGEPVFKSAGIIEVDGQDLQTPGLRLMERREKSVTRDIRESKVLISGGGGIARDFRLLDRLAEALHGMVAASRRVVDLGIAPREIQVGQSGKMASPRLYIALGISGSAQHVAGIRNAEYIISVNKNKQAPICSISDIVLEGDARAFVEGLLNRIETSKIRTYGR
ncbi:MAG: electron transfer flavoprotein subunit alpha/FixB family protein [Chloroflexota bacterium]